ncbi:hypothetical protein OAT42_00815 [Alphaproteobacteria bacterium]|nr:hypothetical protein [Alphaproteobacteria bacterium]
MYIFKQTNILKYGLLTIGLIISLFCFYVVIGFLGIQDFMEPYRYGTFLAWITIFLSVFFRFTFLLLTTGVFLGVINVLEWHWIFAILFTLPSFLFVFPKQFLNFRIKKKSNKNYRTSYPEQAESKFQKKSGNDDIIEGDFEVIKEKNKNE